MTHPGFGSAPPSQACDDGRTLLSSSQRQRVIIAKASANPDAPATLFSQPK